MNLVLVRDSVDSYATLGTLVVGDLTLQTLERPWVPYGAPGGHPLTSCVPAGEYHLETHDSPKHPFTWALVNPALGVYHYEQPLPIVGRYAVLIHVANFVDELEGCIAVGQSRQREADGTPWITLSQLSMTQLHQVLPWNSSHILTISYAQGVNP